MYHRTAVVLHIIAPLALLASAAAEATLIRIDFAGANSSPTAPNVWGTPVPTVTGYLVYDSSTPASSMTGTTATNYANAIKEVSFRMGDTGTVFSGSRSQPSGFGSAQVADRPGGDSLLFSNIILNAAQLEGEVPTIVNGTATRTFNNAQLTLNFQGPNSLLDSQDLIGPFDPASFTRKQLEVFLSYTQQPGGTPAGGWPAVRFNYNLNPVGVTAVPEPAGVLLWLSASGAAIAGLRRRAARVKACQR